MKADKDKKRFASKIIGKLLFLQAEKLIEMQATVFNPIQIHLLKMFALDNSQSGLNELKEVLYRYYFSQMQGQLEEMWQSGELSQQRLNEINQMDLHQLLH